MPDPALHRLLTELTPRGEPTQPVPDGSELARVAEVLGHGAAGWAVEFSRHCFDAVVADIGDERPPVFFTTLARAIERSVGELLLALGEHGHPSGLNSDQVAIVEVLAREGMPFSRIIDGLRIIHRQWTQAVLDRIEGHRPVQDQLRLMRTTTETMTGFFDRTVDAVIAAHLDERQRLIAQRVAGQREVVSAIVAGQTVDPAVAQAVLGVDLDQHHLAFLVWLDDAEEAGRGSAAHSYLEEIAHEVCRTLHSSGPVAPTTLRAWASRARPFGDRDLAAVQETAWAPGVRLAVGRPGTGIAGCRRSHLTADDVHRLARSLPIGTPVVLHHDVALMTLLAGDLERARWFVTEELGPLAADDESELLGRSTEERRLETHAALRLAEVLGQAQS
ncbi:hypothetical protein [Amycolatopsis sacchari]|uniref:Uncharacterized protein n=1 Tax=Amycolatopsis sacchari TaxID=115433 RepID=A0A1I3UNG0_9PSEU|nr:hypothetical protein [Amycolatopsis sacchari]SFJ84243.1 hypothetical protein SAMN05421835_109144 [Amycolatopsis sacchari]